MRVFRIIGSILLVLIPAAVGGYGAWHWSNQQTPEYRSSVKMLVIQQQEGFVDQSQAIRSAERVAQNLAAIVPSEDFLNIVLQSNKRITEKEGVSAHERRRAWDDMVDSRAQGSFILVDVFTPNAEQATNLASTTKYVLSNHANQWHGGQEAIVVKTVDSPLTSEEPVRPQTQLNTVLGATIGLILGISLASYLSYVIRLRQRRK